MLFDPEAYQKVSLSRETGHGQAGLARGFCDPREIDPGADVLQSHVDKRIRMKALTEVTKKSDVLPLRSVVLAPRQAVVDEQHHPGLQGTIQGAQPRIESQVDLDRKTVV